MNHLPAVSQAFITAGRKFFNDKSFISSGSLYIVIGLISSFCFEVNPTTPKYNTVILLAVVLGTHSRFSKFVRVPLLLIFFLFVSFGVDLIFVPDLFRRQNRIAFFLALIAIFSKVFAIYKVLSTNVYARKYLHRLKLTLS